MSRQLPRRGGRVPQGQHLGVGGRVAEVLPLVVAAGDEPPVRSHDHRADRHVAVRRARPGPRRGRRPSRSSSSTGGKLPAWHRWTPSCGTSVVCSLDWDPPHLYRKVIDDDAERAHFLDIVCHREWHLQHDAGALFADTLPVLRAEHPDHAAAIDVYLERYVEMIGGPVPGTTEIVEELHGRRRAAVRAHEHAPRGLAPDPGCVAGPRRPRRGGGVGHRAPGQARPGDLRARGRAVLPRSRPHRLRRRRRPQRRRRPRPAASVPSSSPMPRRCGATSATSGCRSAQREVVRVGCLGPVPVVDEPPRAEHVDAARAAFLNHECRIDGCAQTMPSSSRLDALVVLLVHVGLRLDRRDPVREQQVDAAR